MNLSLCRFFLVAATAVTSVVLGTACSTSPSPSGPIAITKVNPYHLKPGHYVRTDDQMIRFEQSHHLHGAVDAEEYVEKYGDYYTVFWKSKNPGKTVTVRLEYRQANTGAKVHQIDANVTAKKKNVTKFRVNGDYYATDGKVTAWRALVLDGETEVADFKSFLWK